MECLFEKSFSEQVRQNDRLLRRQQRDLERDRGSLEKEEKKLVMHEFNYRFI